MNSSSDCEPCVEGAIVVAKMSVAAMTRIAAVRVFPFLSLLRGYIIMSCRLLVKHSIPCDCQYFSLATHFLAAFCPL
jgi:hypothetical protein